MTLPQCAVWHDADTNTAVPGVVVQAERGDGQVLIGFRPMSGGNLLALLPEFSFVMSPAEFQDGC
jgi:hypothetical protein